MTGTYSPELVALSLLVAIVASYVAFALAAHITATRGWAGSYWLAGGAVAMGVGIWSMHFIGMLAFELPIPMSYDLEATLASLVIAIVVSAFVLMLVSRHQPTIYTLSIGAVAMGVGIALMHYTGMAAMDTMPPITYDKTLVAASVVLAIAASGLALVLAFHLRGGDDNKANTMRRRLLGAGAMGAGICAMHYTGMAAAQFAPDTICAGPDLQLDQFWLAVIVAAVTLIFLGTTMLVLTIDVRMAQQLSAANARIAALARQCPLTGLANRRTFLERLDAAFRGYGRSGTDFAVLFIDLDGFKEINDTLGHAAGDSLLLEVAARLAQSVRRDDLVARFGGDEFAVLQTNISDPSDIGALADKIGTAVAQPYIIGNDEVTVTASIGIAKMTSQSSSPTDLMVQADIALYRAKDDGRNRFRLHDVALDKQVHLRALLARELQSAIARGELELTYVPQVDIASGHIVGLEARVRWNHHARGMIESGVLIPIAERAGMIRAVAQWMIEEVCGQLAVWQTNELAPHVVAVPFFAGQLKAPGDISLDFAECLARHGIAAKCIELAFDEPTWSQAAQRRPELLAALHEKGFRLAIADFGKGASSIAHLAELPAQRLMIAQELVTALPQSPAAATAVRTIAGIGGVIRADVIAVGVSTQAQAAFLLAAGCEQAEGPFFGRAMSPMEATLLLRNACVERPAASATTKFSVA
jgi:diguanylate cyclase (GGDEF)-like protein